IVESIDRNLRFLYSPFPPNSLWPTINYSLTRENVDNFNTILDRVEERIDRLNERVKFVETDDSAFNEEFPGIIDFLYEASELSENSEKQFEKRFIKLAQKLWDLGIYNQQKLKKEYSKYRKKQKLIADIKKIKKSKRKIQS
ncbi:unnamed protein product, partial [Porites lobata]